MRFFPLLFLLAAISPAQSIDASKAIDLTYTFDEKTIYWPTSPGFHWEKAQWGKTPGGYFYSSANYGANEHGGTHLDSPIHFAERGISTEQIPVSKLIAPAIVVALVVGGTLALAWLGLAPLLAALGHALPGAAGARVAGLADRALLWLAMTAAVAVPSIAGVIAGPFLEQLSEHVEVKLTGVPAPAGSLVGWLGGAAIGFSLTVASSILHNDSYPMFLFWSASGLTVQVAAYALLARLFGSKGALAHGMYSVGRAAAHIERQLARPLTAISADFRRPILLPAQVVFGHESLDARSGCYGVLLAEAKMLALGGSWES